MKKDENLYFIFFFYILHFACSLLPILAFYLVPEHAMIDPSVQDWSVMGEAKRRKTSLGDKYGQEENIFPWLPITKTQADKFYRWSTRGAWIGIGVLVAIWVTVRFIGPAFGWWQVN